MICGKVRNLNSFQLSLVLEIAIEHTQKIHLAGRNAVFRYYTCSNLLSNQSEVLAIIHGHGTMSILGGIEDNPSSGRSVGWV
jgi:hypothetical protein